jgi:hypothetical protein
VIFVNGSLAGRGAAFAADQLPGPHCIIVRVGRRMLRYDLTVDADHPIALAIDWTFDTALNISDHWIGLVLPASTSEEAYVRAIAMRMGGQNSLILVGLRRERGYYAVYGSRYEPPYRGGGAHWTGEVHITNAGDDLKLRALARFLTTGSRSPSIEPIGSADEPSGVNESRRWFGYVAGAGAIGAFALGAYSLSKEYGCNRDKGCTHHDANAAAIDYTSIGAGVVLSALTFYWLRYEPKPARAPGIVVMPSGTGGTLTWTRSF